MDVFHKIIHSENKKLRDQCMTVTDRNFPGNRTQSNSIRGLSSIEIINRTKANTNFVRVRLAIEQIELSRTPSIRVCSFLNPTQSTR